MGITGPSSKQPSKVSQAFEEPETAINPRTLTKATTPPVTIRNFFKPKTVEQPLEFNEGTAEDTRETGVEHESDYKECGLETDIKKEVERSEVPIEKQTVSGTSEKEVKSIYFKSSGAKTQERTQHKEPLEGGVRCNSITRHFTEPPSKENLKGKKSLKRNSSDLSLRTSKRQKQSSILCSFGKGTEKSNQNVQKKEIFCPVCGVKFASEAKNADINEHIDGCLAE